MTTFVTLFSGLLQATAVTLIALIVLASRMAPQPRASLGDRRALR